MYYSGRKTLRIPRSMNFDFSINLDCYPDKTPLQTSKIKSSNNVPSLNLLPQSMVEIPSNSSCNTRATIKLRKVVRNPRGVMEQAFSSVERSKIDDIKPKPNKTINLGRVSERKQADRSNNKNTSMFINDSVSFLNINPNHVLAQYMTSVLNKEEELSEKINLKRKLNKSHSHKAGIKIITALGEVKEHGRMLFSELWADKIKREFKLSHSNSTAKLNKKRTISLVPLAFSEDQKKSNASIPSILDLDAQGSTMASLNLPSLNDLESKRNSKRVAIGHRRAVSHFT